MGTRELQDNLISLISTTLGEFTAHLYKEFYENEDDDLLLTSTQDLLIEFIGKKKAAERLAPIYKKFNIQPL